MFGYTMMYQKFETNKMHRCYKNYYCGICFGLEQSYGQMCRFLLSYDVTLAALILGCHPRPLQKKYACLGECKEKKCIFGKENWKQIAAISILLVNEKIKDDINDDHSFRARVGKIILKGKIRKAQKAYQGIEAAISKGYGAMYVLEQQHSSIREIEDSFAEMMVNTLAECKPLTDWEQKYIRCVARWIYYIDALDDYEKDFREKKFNALKMADADTLDLYTKKYLAVIVSDLHHVYRDIPELTETVEKDSTEKELLLTFIKNSMALTTLRVITGTAIQKFKSGSVWDGAIK